MYVSNSSRDFETLNHAKALLCIVFTWISNRDWEIGCFSRVPDWSEEWLMSLENDEAMQSTPRIPPVFCLDFRVWSSPSLCLSLYILAAVPPQWLSHWPLHADGDHHGAKTDLEQLHGAWLPVSSRRIFITFKMKLVCFSVVLGTSDLMIQINQWQHTYSFLTVLIADE